jgi:hypothetical protein
MACQPSVSSHDKSQACHVNKHPNFIKLLNKQAGDTESWLNLAG